MSQTNAIILRIRRDRAREFEQLFEAEEYEIWKRFHAKKLFVSASLTRVEYGSEQEEAKEGGYVNYIVVASSPAWRRTPPTTREEQADLV